MRPDDSLVNATMVVTIQPEDTSIYYLCDWQYKNLPYNNSNYTCTAESMAIYFMQVQHHVFGNNRFRITDNALFSELPNTTQGIIPENQNQYYAIFSDGCWRIYVCNSLTCQNRQWCDYTSCQSHPDECWVVYNFCNPSGSGSGTGGGNNGTSNQPPPPNPGTNNSGGGGNSSVPPGCNTNPVNPIPENAVPPGCEPGWVPVPDEPYDSDLDPSTTVETTLILHFENDYRNQMSQQELAICDNMPRLKQLMYLYNAKSALDLAQNLYPSSIHNGNGDAFRHAYFSALNAKVLGINLAKQLGDAHETFPNSNPLENEMDLRNNQIGRDLWVLLSQNGAGGFPFKTILTDILKDQKIPNGELWRISPLGPNGEILSGAILVPTN